MVSRGITRKKNHGGYKGKQGDNAGYTGLLIVLA